jgi:hypothetical protein bfra3_07007|nr:MAG TPA: hypothetical protein [Caudoviricetes sp.]
MSRDIEDIRHKIYAYSGNDFVFPAIVNSVDETEFTCEVCRDGAVNYFDVRLRSLVNPDLKGISLIPAIGSTVLVCRIGNSNELFVCQFSEFDKLIFTSKDMSLTCNKDKIELLKGEKMSVVVDADGITINADKTTLKAGKAGLVLKRDSSGLKKTLDDLLAALMKLTVTTGVGPSGPPINIADFQKVQQDLNNYLEG